MDQLDMQCHIARLNIRKQVWLVKERLFIPTLTQEEYLARCQETEFELRENRIK